MAALSDSSEGRRRACPFQARRPIARLLLLLTATMLGAGVSRADTIRVPSDYPTIQSAIEAANPDDTILVSPGLYQENLDTLGKRLTLTGEAGAEATIIDGRNLARVLTMTGGGVFEGFTCRNGYAENAGGGLWIGAQPGTVIRNNIIENNITGFFDYGVGGGIFLEYGAPEPPIVVEANQIRNNYAGSSGGGIYDDGLYNELKGNVISGNGCHVCGGGAFLHGTIFMENLVMENWSDSFGAGVCGGGVEIRNNTIVGNFTYNFPSAAGIRIMQARPLIANNVVANNNGIGIHCSSDIPSACLACNDSWGNQGGDYLMGVNCDSTSGRNFSSDPLFCGEQYGDYRISEQSPCAPSGSSGCGLIGAFPAGCVATAIEATTGPPHPVRLTVEPNPISSGAEFSFDGDVVSPVLEIFDPQGRLIARLHPLGQRVRWNPVGSLPRGVYFARLRGTGVSETVKFLVIR